MLTLKILEDHYGKKEMLIRSHINKLLNLSLVLSFSNLKELHNLYDAWEILIRSSKWLGINGNLLFSIIIKLIAENFMLNYNRENKDENQSWNVPKLLDYVKDETETRKKKLSIYRKGFDYYCMLESKTVNKREYLKIVCHLKINIKYR